MTSLHRIEIVDHFKRWTYTNRIVLEMWRIELLWFVLGTHTIRVSRYCHIFNCLTRLSSHTCAHRVTTVMTEKWADNCR